MWVPVVWQDRTKLSKRHGAVSVGESEPYGPMSLKRRCLGPFKGFLIKGFFLSSPFSSYMFFNFILHSGVLVSHYCMLFLFCSLSFLDPSLPPWVSPSLFAEILHWGWDCLQVSEPWLLGIGHGPVLKSWEPKQWKTWLENCGHAFLSGQLLIPAWMEWWDQAGPAMAWPEYRMWHRPSSFRLVACWTSPESHALQHLP